VFRSCWLFIYERQGILTAIFWKLWSHHTRWSIKEEHDYCCPLVVWLFHDETHFISLIMCVYYVGNVEWICLFRSSEWSRTKVSPDVCKQSLSHDVKGRFSSLIWIEIQGRRSCCIKVLNVEWLVLNKTWIGKRFPGEMILELSGRFGFAYLVAANRCRSSVKCHNRCVCLYSHQHYVFGRVFFVFCIVMIFHFVQNQ